MPLSQVALRLLHQVVLVGALQKLSAGALQTGLLPISHGSYYTVSSMTSAAAQVGTERPLAGQVAVVTGGASGIGQATVMALAQSGASVAVVDRAKESAVRSAEQATGLGAQASAFVVDLSEPPAIVAVVEEILAEFGRIDMLVNSAGISGAPHSSLEFSEETFDEVFAVNVKAAFLMVREVGNHMVQRGGGGRIVNLSSSAAFRAPLSPAIYAASKAAICGLTRAAAADLGRYDVNVNAVAPGMTKTPMTAGVGGEDAYQAIVSSGPLENLLHRPAEADEVAAVILFLCLPASRQLTGQVIHTSAGLVV
jgi:NAD(P)-dependent dehydrogenase (short-subunit alcohol dehydrogenase family)